MTGKVFLVSLAWLLYFITYYYLVTVIAIFKLIFTRINLLKAEVATPQDANGAAAILTYILYVFEGAHGRLPSHYRNKTASLVLRARGRASWSLLPTGWSALTKTHRMQLYVRMVDYYSCGIFYINFTCTNLGM